MNKNFANNLKGRFGKYKFEVGILQDSPYMVPARGKRGLHGEDVLTSYAGIKIRKETSNDSGQLVSDVSKANRDRLGFNYLSKPFEDKTSEAVKFTNEFFKYAFGHSQLKRAENLLQACVRNPILRGDYGTNSELTQKIKGFNHPMIDTAQLFRSIQARCTVRSNV